MDRQAGRRRLGDRLAAPARQLRPHMADDAERARHVVQHLGHVFAQRTQRATTFGTGTGRCMLHDVARQRRRQRLAHRLATLCLGLRRRSSLIRFRRHCFRHLLLEFTKQQFELLDLAPQLLRGRAEPLAQQSRQTQFQLLVPQHLLLQPVTCRCQVSHVLLQLGSMLVLAMQQQRAQRDHVLRQSGRIEWRRHARNLPSSIRVAPSSFSHYYTAISGRHVRTGMRQSMPSNSIDN